jgi:Condensin complex subunit 2
VLSFFLAGNLNLSRLDSAFDIDPLFHKMSKTFDEGGAKGVRYYTCTRVLTSIPVLVLRVGFEP